MFFWFFFSFLFWLQFCFRAISNCLYMGCYCWLSCMLHWACALFLYILTIRNIKSVHSFICICWCLFFHWTIVKSVSHHRCPSVNDRCLQMSKPRFLHDLKVQWKEYILFFFSNFLRNKGHTDHSVCLRCLKAPKTFMDC